ncbi:MAG: GNAT family N-acetyltransferase [Pseudomonadota bacterium]
MLRTLTRLIYRLVRLFNRAQTRGLEVRFAESEADLEQVWRLNYETYVGELGHERVPEEMAASGLLPDRLRDSTVYVVALHRGALVGMLALSLPTGAFSIEASLADPGVLDHIRDRTVEYRRLAVRRAWRGKGVFLRMADLSLQWAFSQGYRHAIISALDRQIPTYTRLGYRAFDRPFVKGACTYHPMMCSLDLFLSPGVERAALPLARETVAKLFNG